MTEKRRWELSPSQRGWTNITIGARPEEKNQIKRDAASLGLNVSEYIRALWLEDRRQRGLGPLR